jgi:hypothetical protein
VIAVREGSKIREAQLEILPPTTGRPKGEDHEADYRDTGSKAERTREQSREAPIGSASSNALSSHTRFHMAIVSPVKRTVTMLQRSPRRVRSPASFSHTATKRTPPSWST